MLRKKNNELVNKFTSRRHESRVRVGTYTVFFATFTEYLDWIKRNSEFEMELKKRLALLP